MADHAEDGSAQADLLRAFPIDEPGRKVDDLWQQVMVYKAFADSNVLEAKVRRTQAEEARDKVEHETAAATRRLCETLKAEADEKLRRAEKLKDDAAGVLQQAQADRARARDEARRAEEATKRIEAEAKQRAQELLDQARLTAQQECTELRREALKEIKAILGRIETIREATSEELETQRIYTNISRARSTATSLIPQLSEAQDRSSDGREDQPAREAVRNEAGVDSGSNPLETVSSPVSAAPSDRGSQPAEAAKGVEPDQRTAKGKDKKAGRS